MPIRSGPITGTLHRGPLHLEWAGHPKSGLHFSAVMSYVDHEDPLTSGTITAPAPWPGTARIGSQAGAALAIATYHHTTTLKSGLHFERDQRLLDGPPGRRQCVTLGAASRSPCRTP